MQNEHDIAAQSGFSPVHAPATPSNGRQATPGSAPPQTIQITPSQVEGLAKLGLSGLIPNNAAFSPDSVVSPQSPAYSQNSSEMNGVGTLSPYYAGAPSSGVDSNGVPGSRMVPRALNMDIDLSAFPPSPHSAHSASGSSTGAATPGTNLLRTPYYYPPSGTPVHPPHPTVQRHHPYAHPAHPPRGSQPPTSSALPLYLTPVSAPPTAPTSSASDIPPSAPIASPASNGGFSPSVADPPSVQRVHSAPAHILTLSNGAQDSDGGPSTAMDEGGQPPFGGAPGQEWDPKTPQMNGAVAPGAPQGVSGDWQMDQGHSRQPELVKQEDSQPGFFDGSFAYSQGQPVYTQQQQQQAPPPQQQHHVPQPPPPTPMSAIQLVDAVSAIALLRNRLPIMEAALSTSASDPGGDEEEIWKGVEGAYGELRRIMMSRRDARRGLGRSGTLKASSNRPYSMDLEAPTTPMESRPASTTANFLSVHSHPPLLHSQSSPDVPTVNVQAQRAAQQAQDVANAQAMQRQQVAMQQAQLQQQQQQQHQMQQQMEAQARAEAEGRARAEAEQRARAEDESRLKMEAETQARADAEAADAAARREQQEQYERAVAQQQHQQQQAIVQQQQQQQQQQQLQMQQMQEEHFRQQHEQQMRNQQLAEAQAHAGSAHAQQAPDAQQQQQQQFNAPSDFSLTTQPQLNSPTPQAISNPLPTHLTLSTNLPPSQSSATTSPTSRGATPFTISQQTALVPQNTFAYDANGDMSMGAVMQLHMSNNGTPFTSAPPEGLAPSAILPPPPADDNAGWGNGTPNYAALHAAATGVANLGLSAQASIPSPPTATTNLATRPTRSRAASGSGYVSASGSRSRAASGSGYQSLLETRSRAASSASSVFNMYEREDEDELEEEDGEHEQPVKVSSQTGAASAGVDPELKARMDPVFMEFLADLCSNLDATDSKGEPIHQTLMAKKMEKLDQSTDFRPFKFRIQAFTTAFGEKLIEAGFHETEIPIKKIRQYLWAQPCISRFNDDGKKAKSKGNHIWTIEAKKDPEKKWIFREFVRCIKGIPPSVAFVGLPWVWSPRVWDPQCAISPSDAVFHSPALPSWLSWNENVLSGEAPESLKGQTFEVEAIATFQGGIKSPELRMTCTIVVASANDHEDPTTHIPIPGQLIDTSNQSSAMASPSASAISLHRSPVMRHDSFSSASRHNSFSEHQVPQQLLPSLMAPAAQTSGVNSLASSLSSMDQQQRQDQDFQLAVAQQQEQQRQQQQYIDAAMQANANEMQLDADSIGQQPGFDPSFEAQANLHRHYAAMAAQQTLPFDAASPGSLSFAPPPDLVQTALQQAAMNPTFVPQHANGLLSHPHSEVGTPSGYIGDVDGRLASFVLSNQQQQQQQPYTLDPSQL